MNKQSIKNLTLTALMAILLALCGAVLLLGNKPMTVSGYVVDTPPFTQKPDISANYYVKVNGSLTDSIAWGSDSIINITGVVSSWNIMDSSVINCNNLGVVMTSSNNSKIYCGGFFGDYGSYKTYSIADKMTAYKIDIDTSGYLLANEVYSAEFTFSTLYKVLTSNTGSIPADLYTMEFSLYRYSKKIANNAFVSTLSDELIMRVQIDTRGSNIVIEPPTPPLGYFFDGWYLDENLMIKAEGQDIVSDLDLFAKFSPIQYRISYTLDGGSFGSNGTSYYTVEQSVLLSVPIRTGYTFKGWYVTSTFIGEPIAGIVPGTTGDITFYANWERNKYKVTFYAGGVVYKEIMVNHGTVLSDLIFLDESEPLTEEPTTAGIYYDNALTLGYGDSPHGLQRDITLYTATVSVNIFVEVILKNVADEDVIQFVPYNTAVSELAAPEKEGMKFVGWFADSALQKPYEGALLTKCTLYAKYDKQGFLGGFGQFLSDWLWLIITVVAVLIVFGVLIPILTKRHRGGRR